MLNPLNKRLWSEGADLIDDGISEDCRVRYLQTKFTNPKKNLSTYNILFNIEREQRDRQIEDKESEMNDLSRYPIKDVVVIDKPRCQSCKSPMHVSDIYDGFELCGGLECEAWKKELKKVRSEAKDIEDYIFRNDDLDRYFKDDFTHKANDRLLKTGLYLMTSDEEWFVETRIKSKDITDRLSSV